MSETLTPPKLIAKWRAADKARMDELEERIAVLERHYHLVQEGLISGPPEFYDGD